MATKKKKRNPPKGFRTWSAYMASIRPGAKKRRSASRAKKSTPEPVTSMAKSGRKRAAVRRVAGKARAVASRARGAVSRSGVVPFATTAAMDAAGVLVGKVLVRSIRARTPIAQGTALASLFEIATGVALGMVIGKRSKAWGQRIAIGAMLGPMETLVKRFNIPVASAALGEDGFVMNEAMLSDSELIEAYDDGELSNYVPELGNFVPAGAVSANTYEFGGYSTEDAQASTMIGGY